MSRFGASLSSVACVHVQHARGLPACMCMPASTATNPIPPPVRGLLGCRVPHPRHCTEGFKPLTLCLPLKQPPPPAFEILKPSRGGSTRVMTLSWRARPQGGGRVRPCHWKNCGWKPCRQTHQQERPARTTGTAAGLSGQRTREMIHWAQQLRIVPRNYRASGPLNQQSSQPAAPPCRTLARLTQAATPQQHALRSEP